MLFVCSELRPHPPSAADKHNMVVQVIRVILDSPWNRVPLSGLVVNSITWAYYRGCTQVQGQVNFLKTESPGGTDPSAAMKYTISELAKGADVPTTTVRYYERIGLIEPENRSSGNYRLYSVESLKQLKFIRAAQATGFSLDDIKALLSNNEGGTPTCGSVQNLIEERLEDINRRLKDLRHVRKVLKNALDQCQTQKKTDCCQVVEGLKAH